MKRETAETDTWRTDDMHVICPRAAGLDVHKMCITAAVRLCEAGGGPARTAVREFSALPDGLRAMTDWLRGHGVTAAVMEGTGIFWKAPFEALEEAGIHADVLHAQHVKQVRGKKTLPPKSGSVNRPGPRPRSARPKPTVNAKAQARIAR